MQVYQELNYDVLLLFRAFNACFSDLKVKYTCSAMPFKQMENIATFLYALSKLPNFRSFDLFSTVDLYEGKNMAQVIRCVLACKRFAEKEALSKGIEALKITEDIKVEEKMEEPQINEKEEAKEDFMEITEPEIEEVESEGESNEDYEVETEYEEESVYETEATEYETEGTEYEYKETGYETEETEYETAQPEIVLIDSPVYADDESESQNILDHEPFTQENPGTFEIQVSN